jgi:5-methylcytosine-specific restriction endonuclease McrA
MPDELTVPQMIAEGMKKCYRCKVDKPVSEFHKNASYCKKCACEKSSEWYYKNKKKALEYSRKWAAEHPEKSLASKSKYRNSHRVEDRAYQKLRRKRFPEKDKARQDRWRLANPVKVGITSRRALAKQRSVPKGIINHRVGTSIRETLKGTKNGQKWQLLVGYTLDNLRKHLESRFLPNMSWENMADWHIDHKIPIAAFNFSSPSDIDFKRCWALSNLQPLWSKQNISKHAKLEKPFQPALAMGL